MADYSILLVDDQREVRETLSSAIETLGPSFFVKDVPSGEEALLELSLGQFDLIVSDVRLPGISGLELISKVKARDPDARLILMTGMKDTRVRQEVADAGASAFFLKPIDVADFLDAVERCLGLVDSSVLGEETLAVDESVESVSDQLAGLRKELDAISAVLLDERGRVLARAGDLPDASVETALFPALMGAFSAGSKVAQLLKTTPPNDLMFFAGSKYDLFLAHVGESYALLVAANPGSTSDQVHAAMKTVHKALKDIFVILDKMGVPLKSEDRPATPPFDPPEEPLEVEPEIEALFQGIDPAKIDSEEANAFWDTATLQLQKEDFTNADALTYEQARQLGLAPDDEAEEG